MAVRKVMGIETEYGIMVRGGDTNPVGSSSLLVNSYVAATVRDRVAWDFEDEAPGCDARGAEAAEGAMAPEVETHLVNTVLHNGARFYVDHAHPEYSSPECADARSVVLYDAAGEAILARAAQEASGVLPAGQSMAVYKNNSDGKGNSYGCHENYLLDRAVAFDRIVEHLPSHLVTRQIFAGAGKAGCEFPGRHRAPVGFQISQRADFFEEVVGLETTLRRPIINTRDEPHADAARYRRLHVICGDANRAEFATYLKVGTTALILAMIEDDEMGGSSLALAAPVAANRAVSLDLSLSEPLALVGGRTMTALDVQWEHLERARKYAASRGLEAVGAEVGADVLERWEAVLTDLEADPLRAADRVDWVAKHRMVSGYRRRHKLNWGDPRLAALDLQYHDVRPERSLAARAGLSRLTTDEEVARAMTEPPRDTRAWFRGRCLARYGAAVVAANWDSLVFDLGSDPLRRVPMMEPLRGTAEHVDSLLEACRTPSELLAALGQPAP
ncbi:MAG: depupylase/deamidase Dop [Acidimicrobiales bacterium]